MKNHKPLVELLLKVAASPEIYFGMDYRLDDFHSFALGYCFGYNILYNDFAVNFAHFIKDKKTPANTHWVTIISKLHNTESMRVKEFECLLSQYKTSIK